MSYPTPVQEVNLEGDAVPANAMEKKASATQVASPIHFLIHNFVLCDVLSTEVRLFACYKTFARFRLRPLHASNGQ